MTRLGIRVVRTLATVLLLGWAAFWLWFCGAVLVSEWDGTIPWEPVLKIVLPIIVLTGLGLVVPRIGGLLLIAASVWAWLFFDSMSSGLWLALPMLMVGVMLAVTGPWVRRLRRPADAQAGVMPR